MPTLPVQSDLVNIYGTSNINQWGSVDNDGDDVAIANRVTWAITQGANYVLGRLERKFAFSTFTTLPSLVFNLIVMRAGIELYKMPRGLVDGDPASAMINAQKLEVDSQLDQIISGQIDLIDLDDADTPSRIIHVNNETIPGNKHKVKSLIRIPDGDASFAYPLITSDDSFYPSNP